MNFKRNIKLFFADHRDSLLFWSIVIGVIIWLTQSLNSYYKNKKEDNNNEVNNEIELNKLEEEKYHIINDKENKILIQTFLNYCINEQIEEAYNLLGQECKKNLYPTLKDFEKKYINKVFNKKRNIQIEQEENEYKIIFYEDILETGKIEGRESIIDYYRITDEVLESKININLKNEIK